MFYFISMYHFYTTKLVREREKEKVNIQKRFNQTFATSVLATLARSSHCVVSLRLCVTRDFSASLLTQSTENRKWIFFHFRPKIFGGRKFGASLVLMSSVSLDNVEKC